MVEIVAETDQFEQSSRPVVLAAEVQAGCAVPDRLVNVENRRAPEPP